jgi:hypothetical protein
MTKNLMKALCAAMSEMRDPVKRSANPHFKSRFADLREVLDCIEEPLGRHGLVFTQLLAPSEAGLLLLRSQLHHADSGEMIEAVVPIVPEKPGPQALGSCISYMRRYSAKAMFSLADADEDDDGEAATNRTSYVNIGARKPQEQPAPKAVARDEVSAPELVGAMREARNLAALDALAQKAKHLSEREKAEIREVFKARRAELQEAP